MIAKIAYIRGIKMKSILMGIGYANWENELIRKLKLEKRFVFTEVAIDRGSIIAKVKQYKPDIAIFREALTGQGDWLEIIYTLRKTMPELRIIFITKMRDVGDEFLSALTSYGVYDLMVGDSLRTNDVIEVVLRPRTFDDISKYIPEVVIGEDGKKIYTTKTLMVSDYSSGSVNQTPLIQPEVENRIIGNKGIFNGDEKDSSAVAKLESNHDEDVLSLVNKEIILDIQPDEAGHLRNQKAGEDANNVGRVPYKKILDAPKEILKKTSKPERRNTVIVNEDPEEDEIVIELFDKVETDSSNNADIKTEGLRLESLSGNDELVEELSYGTVLMSDSGVIYIKPKDSTHVDVGADKSPKGFIISEKEADIELIEECNVVEDDITEEALIVSTEQVSEENITTFPEVGQDESELKLDNIHEESPEKISSRDKRVSKSDDKIVAFFRTRDNHCHTALNTAILLAENGKSVVFINTIKDSINEHYLVPDNDGFGTNKSVAVINGGELIALNCFNVDDIQELLKSDFDKIVIDALITSEFAQILGNSLSNYFITIDQDKHNFNSLKKSHWYLCGRGIVVIEEYSPGLMSIKAVQKSGVFMETVKLSDSKQDNFNAYDSGVPSCARKKVALVKSNYDELFNLLINDIE